jgi:hypothetical protein
LIKFFKIKFLSVPTFNVTRREVDIISKETVRKNNNKTEKSMVYFNFYNLILRLFRILFFEVKIFEFGIKI